MMKTNQFRTTMFALLIAVVTTGILHAQCITVKGTVTDANDKSALVGCSVILKGTKQGTITDPNGKYSIKANIGDTLEFRYIGCLKELKRIESSEVNAALKPDAMQLEECVVMGYSVQRKPMLCGSVMTVTNQSPRAFYNRNLNQNEFAKYEKNEFKTVAEAPLSTFSIDVDAASYGYARSCINGGELPDTDAIRTEELINYFSYNYPKPTGNDPVGITTEVGTCPWNAKHRLVRIGLKAKEIPTENLPESNLVFLIDVSGSMSGLTRLDLVKSSLKLLVNNLRAQDKVSIVVYSGEAGEALAATPGNRKQEIRDAIDNLEAGGSTAGGEGILLAYKIAKKNFIKGGNNRIILCTDGDFNVGVSSEKELEKLIETERKSGVFLTVLGYGMGNYKDNKMQVLAEKGNGNHAYIDNMQEANRVLVNEFGATMHTVAKDVKLQIEFNPSQVQAYRLIGYESRLLDDKDFNNDAKDAGELGAGHTVTAFYEVVPAGVNSDYVGKVDELRYQKVQKNASEPHANDLLTIKLRYKEPDGDTSKKIVHPVVDSKTKNVSSDFRFASAVALFGQLLSSSEYIEKATYNQVIKIARTALDNDEQGYRREFVKLVEVAKGLSKAESSSLD